VVDGHCAKRGHVDAERMQILKGLTAQELAANLVTRCRLALDQSNASSLAAERYSGRTPCNSTTDDENFISPWNPIVSDRSIGWNFDCS
jgi:hypothetical protein